MALEILHQHAIDLENSFMIGDKLTDQLFLPGLKSLLLQGNYSLEGTRSPTFKELNDIQIFISEYYKNKDLPKRA